jgi:hypothetical protein
VDTSVVAIVTTGAATACGSCASLNTQLNSAIADKNAALDISLRTQTSCDAMNAELSAEKKSLAEMMEVFSKQLSEAIVDIHNLKEENKAQAANIDSQAVKIEAQAVKIEAQAAEIKSLAADILAVFGCTRAHFLALAAEILRRFLTPTKDSQYHPFTGFFYLSDTQADTISHAISDLALEPRRFQYLANQLINDRNHAVHFEDFTELHKLADEALHVFSRMIARHHIDIDADESMKLVRIVLEKRHLFLPPSLARTTHLASNKDDTV